MGTAAPGPGNTRLRDNTITGVADSNRHAGHRHALSQDFRILTLQQVGTPAAQALVRLMAARSLKIPASGT